MTCKPLTTAQMELQRAKCHEWIRKGDLDGLVLCSNTLAEVGIEAADCLRTWIRQMGGGEV